LANGLNPTARDEKLFSTAMESSEDFLEIDLNDEIMAEPIGDVFIDSIDKNGMDFPGNGASI
jgi:hypothetical protein